MTISLAFGKHLTFFRASSPNERAGEGRWAVKKWGHFHLLGEARI